MITYLPHKKIDKIKWDECISHSLNSLIYAYSWYLDEAAPGWDALVIDDYEAVFPLTHRRKFFIRYLYQPHFTQQLGLFYKTNLGAEQLAEVIRAIPKKFRFTEINLNESNRVEDKNLLKHVTEKRNYILELNRPYLKLFKNFSDQHQRNIKRAGKSGLKAESVDLNEVIKLYIKIKGRETLHVGKKDYQRLSNIAKAFHRNQLLISTGIRNTKNQLIAGGLFSVSNNRIVYHLGTSNEEGREKRAMHFLFSDLIEKYAGQNFLFDFEGSEIPGIAHFFKGFGARKQVYFKLHINKLPWFMKLFKK
ncbi:MAG: hypothetical protein ACHQK8_01240 [Bacteroidia bacterium]